MFHIHELIIYLFRYKKSMDCYKVLVNIRAFTLKRQTLQGKTGIAFRELHSLLSALE